MIFGKKIRELRDAQGVLQRQYGGSIGSSTTKKNYGGGTTTTYYDQYGGFLGSSTNR